MYCSYLKCLIQCQCDTTLLNYKLTQPIIMIYWPFESLYYKADYARRKFQKDSLHVAPINYDTFLKRVQTISQSTTYQWKCILVISLLCLSHPVIQLLSKEESFFIFSVNSQII